MCRQPEPRPQALSPSAKLTWAPARAGGNAGCGVCRHPMSPGFYYWELTVH